MKPNRIYEIEFRYNDEEDFHYAYILIYDTSTIFGETIQHALDCVSEDDDTSGLDKLLYDHFQLDDAQICWYFDVNDMAWDLKTSIERCYDIEIKDMWVERESSRGEL